MHAESDDVVNDCSHCSKSYSSVSQLNRHLLSHSNGPYECQYCDEQFRLKTECYYHERRGKLLLNM